MGGNVGEFTTELNPNTCEAVVLRGVGYDNGGPAGNRWDIISGNAWDFFGFRSALFLK